MLLLLLQYTPLKKYTTLSSSRATTLKLAAE
jgi:hypothetical protein